MPINSIKLKNFQSHKETVLDFADGMNVIHGASDNGKSSIIRGIRWVVLNRPTGEEFRRHGTKKTSVTIKTNNSVIQRIRTDTKNEYRKNKNTYKALHTAVPEDISESLNLSEINIQPQQEVYFLIDKSPGQRSKILNEVAGFQVMDKVLKKTNSEIRSINSDIRHTNNQLLDAETVISNLDWINKAEKFLIKLENYRNNIDELICKQEKITPLVNDIVTLEAKKKQFFSDKFLVSLDELLIKKEKLDNLHKKHDKIVHILQRIDTFQKEYKSITVIDISEFQKLNDKIDSEKTKQKRLSGIIQEISNQKKLLMKINTDFKKTRHEIDNELKRLGKCPTCGVVVN